MGIFKTIREYRELAKLQSKMARHFQSFPEQKQWLNKLKTIDEHVKAAHNQSHILQFLTAILELPATMKGCVVEAGAYKGSSAAKISLFAAHRQRQVYCFDSFEGLPENNEQHTKSTEGHSIQDWFKAGNFSGSLEEVKKNVEDYGDSAVCQFIKGWFEDTMSGFKEPVALAYLDVDLASSTRTCLKYLYPLLSPGGAIYSQDGDFPLVIEVFKDESFWINEVGCSGMPEIEGLGKKITIIRKNNMVI